MWWILDDKCQKRVHFEIYSDDDGKIKVREQCGRGFFESMGDDKSENVMHVEIYFRREC